MLKRLVDNDIIYNDFTAKEDQIKWWFLECRDVDILIKLAKKYPTIGKQCIQTRPLLQYVFNKNIHRFQLLLTKEENKERIKDTTYWNPLKKELEKLRHSKA
ncbi:MAG: hypothetical protein ABII23_03275 [bacterium]